MATDHDTHTPPELTLDAAVHAPPRDAAPRHTLGIDGAAQPHNEATLRAWEGLPPDAMILSPVFGPPPMRCPDSAWAMLVTAVDIISDVDPDHAGEVALFAGTWVREEPPVDSGLYDGDLVVRLNAPTAPSFTLTRNRAADVEMLLAYQGRWHRIGQWHGIGRSWPSVVAPTAAAVMGLHSDATEAVMRPDTASPPTSPPLIRWARSAIAELLAAGLVTAGDELVWNRRILGVRHTARIRADGALILADGRTFANPCGAAAALCRSFQNGWNIFSRMSDGRTLGELRAELRVRRGKRPSSQQRPLHGKGIVS
ncbi:hypothetical protein [Amycolatopsis sp. NPDC059657]|uniref:restriction system modified-DNA reader domain-containing protein n=1 Tax=Amycolatopsis sp. NPDC059657 TaxID=3346899 RepID=UPI00366C206C